MNDSQNERTSEDSVSDATQTEFELGAMVRLVGLSNQDFNHHVGIVVAHSSERVGVRLHNSVWVTEAPGRSRYKPVMIKRSNLRLMHVAPNRATVLGCIPAAYAERLLGESGWGLTATLANQVVDFLQIQRVHANDVSMSGCSSRRGDFPISVALNAHEDEWWISDSGTMPGGVGEEYLEISLGPVPRRVSFVGMKIPPLPGGPLSVREFHILAWRGEKGLQPNDPAGWQVVSAKPLRTLDRGDLQEFALVPPCETKALRVVCTQNAAADDGLVGFGCNCIGLFQISVA
eukprot:TRINITY_DN41220_c0_g1_i1.p1 TRINITY_DN41220_c0_g1~~TRINITY_DN41220_c0_g1_i1.p1  ORF type:complete len:325 (-),score=26.79 TRINITY_DN41220_c0_g1_i1:215-1081(-)